MSSHPQPSPARCEMSTTSEVFRYLGTRGCDTHTSVGLCGFRLTHKSESGELVQLCNEARAECHSYWHEQRSQLLWH